MSSSKLKRSLALLAILLAAAFAAAALYAWPRRTVPDMLRLVPRDGLAACVRARGLGPVWRRCARSEFGRKVGRGEIFPINEMIASDKEYREEWEDIDTRFWPELFGRDCVVGVYAGGPGAPLRTAAWARVGFRTRLFHLWERTRGAVRFGRAKRIRTRRVGGLVVASVMNRKRGTVDASYALLGDLGIATPGRGDGFWERVAALVREEGGDGRDARGLLPDVPDPARGTARGGLFADIGALRRGVDDRIAAAAGESRETGGELEALWGPARALVGDWTTATASFTIGDRTEAEARIGRTGGVPAKPLSVSPLERLMARRGLLYLAGAWDPPELLSRARKEWPRGRVRFDGRGAGESFPVEHFSLGWLGSEWDLVLYLDPRGMLNAAASFPVADRRIARRRLERFMKLANGAVVSFSDGRGGGWTPLAAALDIEAAPAVKGLCYRVGPGAPLEYLYNPTVILQGGRLVVASADPRDDAPGEGGAADAAAPGARGAAGKLILRGSAADRTAASLRQILAIAGAFTGERRDRQRIDAARRALGALEWLAPVREARLYLSDGKDATRASLSAEIADIRAP